MAEVDALGLLRPHAGVHVLIPQPGHDPAAVEVNHVVGAVGCAGLGVGFDGSDSSPIKRHVDDTVRGVSDDAGVTQDHSVEPLSFLRPVVG